jgi:hypothetical protein
MSHLTGRDNREACRGGKEKTLPLIESGAATKNEARRMSSSSSFSFSQSDANDEEEDENENEDEDLAGGYCYSLSSALSRRYMVAALIPSRRAASSLLPPHAWIALFR